MYLAVLQATSGVTANTAAAAAADGLPPFDDDVTLGAGCGICPQFVTVSGRAAAVAANKVVTADACGDIEGGRSARPVLASEPPPSPSRLPSRAPAQRGQPREKAPENNCVYFEALATPMVHLGCCSHRLYLPCYTPHAVSGQGAACAVQHAG